MRHPRNTTGLHRRGGFILLAVLVVVVLLALAAYQFSDLMSAEYRVADSYRKSVQAKALADSGVAYAAALLSNPDAFANDLTGVYATDPNYGANLITIMRQYNLYRYDAATSAARGSAAGTLAGQNAGAQGSAQQSSPAQSAVAHTKREGRAR